MTSQHLRVMPGTFVVEHHPDGQVPDSWLALARSPEGVTAVREATEGDLWIAYYGGETAHGLDVPGMLAALLTPLAAAGISVFVASTYHADLVLVPLADQFAATAALTGAGHTVAPA